MALNRVPCPECGAGLKSPTGFKVGQNVCCPKCETYFTVEEPTEAANAPAKAAAGTGKRPVKAAAVADDEDFDQPKKKRRASEDDDDSGRSYKNSPARYAVLGVLVCVMVGLGVVLYLKKRGEGKDNDGADNNRNIPAAIPPANFVPPPEGGPAGAGVNIPGKKGPFVPKPKTPPVGGGGVAGGGGLGIPFLDGGASLSPAETAAKVKQYQQRIIGTWTAKLGSGTTAELVYRADGTFTDTLTTGGAPKMVTGTWTADRLIAGGKGILITRTVSGARTTVKAEFEGDELLHDTQDRGTLGAFRK